MHDSFGTYVTKKVQNTHQAIINLLLFIPYFFSLKQLIFTLFAPWKNVHTFQDKPGVSLQEIGQQLADSFASRLIGFIVRSSILIAGGLFILLFVFILPPAYVLTILTLPLRYAFYLIQPSQAQMRQMAYQNFLKRHIADEKNLPKVIEWFELYYQSSQPFPWWSKARLMNHPPLGRDLTAGFTNILDQFSSELTLQQPHYRHLVGRKHEIDVIQRILSKSSEANVLLNGEVGVGRHAIIEALAKSIYEGSSVNQLAYKRVIELDMEKILAQETDSVRRVELLESLFQEAEDAKNIILVINNLERYVSTDVGHLDMTAVFEKYANSNQLQLIATTVPYMFQKYIFPNRKIADTFEKVDIPEISKEQALRVLLDNALDFEKRYSLAIVYDALEETINLADRHITERPFPEKSFELLDEVCVYAKSQRLTAVNGHLVHTVVQQKTHAPTELTDSIKQKLLHLESSLRERILFQDHALQTLAGALRKSFIDLGNRKKPLASLLFLGPTGVGKTETAKAVTQAFFESEKKMMRFDMSNYQSLTDIPILIGSAITNEPGHLTEAVRNERYGVLLLDELEKAHPDLLNIFLTVFDEGYFTDGLGNRVDCTNLIVIATSNAAADFIFQAVEKGISAEHLEKDLIDYLVTNSIFAPEFLNRFDGVVVYKPLYKEAIMQIAAKIIRGIVATAQSKYNLHMNISDVFLADIVNKGYDPRFGARDLRRLIQESIEDPIAKIVLEGKASGATISL